MSRCPFAQWVPSPNHSPRRDERVDRIVVHVSDGGPRLDHLVERLTNPVPEGSPVSAHFAVGRGVEELVQLVDTELAAWHASGWNGRSVGIEHCARTPGELDRRGRWAALSYSKRIKLLDHGAPVSLTDSPSDPGLLPTAPQLATSARLVAWLCRELGLPVDAEHVVGHCVVPGTTHTDCGRDVANGGIWPWADYLEMVREEFARLG